MNTGTVCESQAELLNTVLDKCGSSGLKCQKIDDSTMLLDEGDGAPGVAGLKAMLKEYTRGTDYEITIQIGSIVSFSGKECATGVEQMNAALASFLDGTFADCEMTTPTSSVTTTETTTTMTTSPTTSITSSPSTTVSSTGTSTQTTTPTTTTTVTTTGTTTALYPRLECTKFRNLAPRPDSDCRGQAALVTQAVAKCFTRDNGVDAAAPEYGCEQEFNVLTADSDGVDGLNSMIKEFSAGDSSEPIIAVVGSVVAVKSGANCDVVVAYINDAIEVSKRKPAPFLLSYVSPVFHTMQTISDIPRFVTLLLWATFTF